MEEADITFLLVVGIGCIFFTMSIFIWRGIIWLNFISSVFWLIFGFFLIGKTQEGTILFSYQDYIQIVFIGVGIVMLFSPMWLSTRDTADIGRDAPNDIDIWGDGNQFSDEAFNKHINSSRRTRRW